MTRPPLEILLRALPGLVIALLVIFAPILTPYDPFEPAPDRQFSPPDAAHLAGTDQFGRDVVTRLLWGGRASLLSSMLATVIAVAAGVTLGALAGAVGGWVDWAIMRGVDILLALPGLLVALSLVAMFGPGMGQVALGVGISLAPGFTRVVRAAILSIRDAPFVEAARALGATRLRIIHRHLLPNVLPQIAAFAAVLFGWSLLNIAGMEFLGLAGSPSAISWGRMLADGRGYLRVAAWIALAPGTAIVLTTLSLISLSDWWRSHLENSHDWP